MVNHVHETSVILAVFLIQESAAVAVVVVVGFHAVGSLFHPVLIWSCCLNVSQNLQQETNLKQKVDVPNYKRNKIKLMKFNNFFTRYDSSSLFCIIKY